MTEEQEGPSTYTYSRQSCMGCKWHDQRMIKSGQNPIYWHHCKHPDSQRDMSKAKLDFEVSEKGRYIGQSSTTPAWCPFLSNNDV